QTLHRKIRAVEGAIKHWEPRVVDANERLAQYQRFKLNLERVQGLRDRLSQAIHNVDVNKSVDQESVTIMDRALVFPTPRRLALRVGMASGVGLFLGIALVLFLERSDRRLWTPREFQLNLQLRLLGCVPEWRKQTTAGELTAVNSKLLPHSFVESF